MKRNTFGSIVSLSFAALAWNACSSPKAAQMRGTEISTDGDGNMSAVTYVSPEEYDRMTPEERARIHAAVGVKVSQTLWGKPESAPRPISSQDLDNAMAEAKKNSAK